MNHIFEMGPIRPPSEAFSLLVRVTRNCPWNKCAFCATYKDQQYSKRATGDVLRDIDNMHEIASRIMGASQRLGYNGLFNEEVIREARGADDDTHPSYYNQIAYWLHYGMKTAFLQDANSLVLKTNEIIRILRHLQDRFPTIRRVTSYARASTMARKSLEELKDLRAAGLARIHIGMESGCDEVLELVSKGVKSAAQIEAGRKAIAAGFDLSEYYMPGLGGRERWRENASESARVINAVNPTFIRIRTTVPLPGTPLHDLSGRGEWTPMGEDEKVRELRFFVEKLDGITSTLQSDHMMNLLEDVEGSFPGHKQEMLDTMDRYLAMCPDERESFIIGRRIGRYRYLSDFTPDSQVEELKSRLITEYGTIDEAVREILKNFI
jgi:radical SAM superfamily enzyme YgiQ (UPF0313 family)